MPQALRASFDFAIEPGVVYRRTGEPVQHVFHDYQRTEAMIPMRDGVKLHAVILKPADIAAPLPFLIQRTPYGVDGTTARRFLRSRPELARDGYIYVAEDIRGRYKSEGKFVMMRPLADHHNPKAMDESTDAYDTVAWLLKNVPGNNGRAGVRGHQLSRLPGDDGGHRSAPGGEGDFAAGAHDRRVDGRRLLSQRRLPPELRIRLCAGHGVEQRRTPGQLRQGQGGQAGGRIRLLSRARQLCPGREAVGLEAAAHLEAVPRSPGVRLGTGRRAAWRMLLNAVTVPTLSVGGYYDQEDMYGPQEEYAKLEPHDTKHENFLVLGPWRHGYWSSSSSRHLGNLDYGEPIGKEFRAEIEAKFFAHYLKDRPAFRIRPRRHGEFSDRLEHLEVLRALSAAGIAADEPLSRGRGALELDRVDSRGREPAMSAIPPIRFPIATGLSSRPTGHGFAVVQLAD